MEWLGQRQRGVAVVVLAGLVLSILVTTVLAPLASSDPDGLERVAEDLGFADSEAQSATAESALADYALGGVSDEGWSTRGAGLIGLVVTAGVGVVVFSAVRRRSAGHDRAR